MTLSREEFAHRLIRSRQWHLREAGRQRFVASEAVASAVRQTELHDAAVRQIDAELSALGAPQPPAGPGGAVDVARLGGRGEG